MIIERARTVDQLLSENWDDLVGAGDFYASTDGFRYYEAFLRSRAWYLLGRSPTSQRLVAGLSCHFLDVEDPASPFTRLDQVLARLCGESAGASARMRAHYLLPALLCGSRTAGYSRALCRESHPSLRHRSLRRLVAEAETLAREVGARTMSFLYVDDNDGDLGAILPMQEWLTIRNGDYYVLDIAWTDFNGYLAPFQSKRRISIKRERQKLREAGIQMHVGPLDEAVIPELAALEELLKRRYGSPRTAENIATSFRTLLHLYPGRVTVVTARQLDAIRGFAIFVQWGDDLVARDTGFDYDFQGGSHLPLYFETIFYTPAEWAPTHGVRRIHYGMEADEAKRNRGCWAIGQTSFIKALDPEAEGFLRDLLAHHKKEQR